MKNYIFLLLLVPFIFIGCQKDNIDDDDNENNNNETETIDENKILELVNEVRENGCKCGNENMPAVDALQWNDKLEEAAQNHSDWMFKEDNLDHTGENNSSPGDRIAETGYAFSTWAENIAWNYPDEEAVIEGWLDSEGHCKNIMNANMSEMGVAKVGAYWTQVFAAPNSK